MHATLGSATGRDMANLLLNRCVAEGLARGFLAAEEDDSRQAAYLNLAEQMGSDQSQDLVIGTQSVAETTEDRIRWIAQVALRRSRLLDQVIGYLGSDPDSRFESNPLVPG